MSSHSPLRKIIPSEAYTVLGRSLYSSLQPDQLLRNGSGIIIIKDLKYLRHSFKFQICASFCISCMVKRGIDMAEFIAQSLFISH